jgi:Ca2+-transporting ATPase
MHATDVRRPAKSAVVERAHALPADDVAAHLHVNVATGLTAVEVERRRDDVGLNALPAERRTPLWSLLLRQLGEPMALLLLAAAALSATVLGERLEAAAIAVLVAVNAAIATAQEGRAASALAALRRLEVTQARVRRDAAVQVIAAVEIVPGDIVLLEPGDRVPADLRLLQADQLEVDESILTGESLPATKDPAAVTDVGAALGDRHGMMHSGTFVTRGRATGVVVATGTATQLGAIARHIEQAAPTTPLQRDLAHVTRRLATVAILIASAVLLLTVLRMGVGRESLEQSILTGVALAVAAIPEGLATVTAVGLALGVRRMADHGAIIRRLPAVETLGAASVLVIDKTGTLTENRLTLDAVMLATYTPTAAEPSCTADAEVLQRIAVLCNDATVDPAVGDPTELALLDGLDHGQVADVRRHWPRVAGAPFDAARKRMSTVHRAPDGTAWLFVKGAHESVLARCATMRQEGATVALDDHDRQRLDEAASTAAASGRRVLAFAQRQLPAIPADVDAAASDLELIGLITLRDQIRSTAARSGADAETAGITLVMATGDHPGTATAIATDVGLSHGGAAITDTQLRADGFAPDPAATPIYARLDPDQKLALVETLQRQDRVVLDATRQIAEAADLAHVHVLILTTFDHDEYVIEALGAGASGFVIKNTDPGQLLHGIRVVAGGEALLSPGLTRRLVARLVDRGPNRQVNAGALAQLTAREREVAGLAAYGMSNDEIAVALFISQATAKTHISRAMAKLGARTRAQLVALAYQHRLIDPPDPTSPNAP